MKLNKKKHDKLPTDLVKYCRKPGARKRSRSASKGRGKGTGGGKAAAAADGGKVRWATKYCHDHADKPGSCKRSPCAFPHLTEKEAKAVANGVPWTPKAGGPPAKPAGVAALAGAPASSTAVITDLSAAASAVGHNLTSPTP